MRKPAALILVASFLFLLLSASGCTKPPEDAETEYKRGNFKDAYQLYKPLAEGGDAKAQYKLGLMYEGGQGVEKDRVEAGKWYRKSAEQGDADALRTLGWRSLYRIDADVVGNLAEVADLFRHMAEQGNVIAQYYFGGFCEIGIGVAQNYEEAVKWYRKAADRGNSKAQESLGRMYEHGHSVPKNYVLAHMWYNLAAAKGTSSTSIFPSDDRDRVASKMTPEQIIEAQRLAREWKPKKEGKSGERSN